MANDQAQWDQLVASASQQVKAARLLDADWPPNSLEEADRWLDVARGGDSPPPPPPPPPPVAMFVAPLPNGAIYGRTKWMPGLGCDAFYKRGTALVAPADCQVKEVIGGTGLQGGAEIILATTGNAWAWRYRHNQAVAGGQARPGRRLSLARGVTVGSHVAQGQLVAVIGDSSLDMLGPIPLWAVQQAGRPFPDGWQHLDLSVSRGTDQFAPTGGGGGNYSAYQWLTEVGYQGTVLARTPGPPDAMRGLSSREIEELINPRRG